MLQLHGNLMEYSLNKDLNETKSEMSNDSDETNEQEADSKEIIKSLDYLIEAKLLSIDLISIISSYFIEDDNNEDDDEYESLSEDEEQEAEAATTTTTQQESEMDVEMEKTTEKAKIDKKEIVDFKNTINYYKYLTLLVKSLTNDNENSYQANERIEHVYNSIKLIKNESLKAYLLLIENFYIDDLKNETPTGTLVPPAPPATPEETGMNRSQQSDVDLQHLFMLFKLILDQSSSLPHEQPAIAANSELTVKLAELVYDLFVYFNNSPVFTLSLEQNLALVNMIKDILLKYKISVVDLCIRLGRVLGLMAIKQRDANLDIGKEIISVNILERWMR
jgi:hypothetical protein